MATRFPVTGFQDARLLEEGDRSSLWRATAPQGPVLVRLYPDPAWPGAEGERLRRGCARLEGLEHPSIPRPVTCGQQGDSLYLVLPDPGSWTLAEHLHGTPLGAVEAAETILQIAEGLVAAQAVGLGHGRLRPESTWIEAETGRIRLLGLEAGADREAQTDLKALGDLLAFLLTARDEAPDGPALRRLCPELPPPLEWMVSRLRRAGTPSGYASAGEVVADLESWLADQTKPTPDRPPKSSQPDQAGLWAEVQAPAPPPETPLARLLWPALGGVIVLTLWLGWLVLGSRAPGEPTQVPDEVVFTALEDPASAVRGQPGQGILSVEVRGLRPPSITARLKVRDGDQVVAEADLPAGRGQVEIPRGRLLQLEVSADLHSRRTRTLLLEETQGSVTLRTVLVRLTEVTISTVPGAQVYLDRKPIGQADPRGVLMLPPGSIEMGRFCLVSASKVGYQTREETFTVKQGHTVVLLDLAPSRGPGNPPDTGPAAPVPLVAPPSGPFPGPLPAPPQTGAGPAGPVGPPPPPVLLRPSPARTRPQPPQAPSPPSPSGLPRPAAPVFPQVPPAPLRTTAPPPTVPVAPAVEARPGAAPPPVPHPAPAPAVAPNPPSVPGGGHDLPVLTPDN